MYFIHTFLIDQINTKIMQVWRFGVSSIATGGNKMKAMKVIWVGEMLPEDLSNWALNYWNSEWRVATYILGNLFR